MHAKCVNSLPLVLRVYAFYVNVSDKPILHVNGDAHTSSRTNSLECAKNAFTMANCNFTEEFCYRRSIYISCGFRKFVAFLNICLSHDSET